MAYSEQIKAAADDALEARRLRYAELSARRRDEALKAIPGLAAMEAEIAETGASCAAAVLSDSGSGALEALKSTINELKRREAALLTEHGFEPDALEPSYGCEICRDAGFTPQGAMCSCVKKLLADRALSDVKRSSPLSLCSFDSFSLDYYSNEKDADFGISPRAAAAENLKACRAFAERFPNCENGLLLLGDAGLGKTHLALSVANDILTRGFDVIYCGAASILKRIEAEYFEEYHSSETLDNLKRCSLLVLDDLGAEFNNAFVRSALYDLVDVRINSRRPTIYTTNFLKQDALIARYGEKISSRLLGCCVPLAFFGEDIRLIKNGEKS